MKSTLNIHWKDWSLNWSSNTLATWCEELTHWKRSWCWKDWGQEEKGATEDEMVGWYHWLNGYEFEQTLGDSEGQGSLAYCSPWGCKELNMTWQLNNHNNMIETVIYHVLSVVFSSIWQNSWLNWGASQANYWLQHSVISTQSTLRAARIRKYFSEEKTYTFFY